MSKKKFESEKEVSKEVETKKEGGGENKRETTPKSRKYQEMTLEDFDKLPHYVPRPPFP